MKVLQTSALPLGYGAIINYREGKAQKKRTRMYAIRIRNRGADYGARTRHLDLGKVALYQMS
jgi:hypothetical protein